MSLMKFHINHGQGQEENERNVLKLYQIKNVWYLAIVPGGNFCYQHNSSSSSILPFILSIFLNNLFLLRKFNSIV